MSLVEIDCVDLRRPSGKIGQCVTPARCNRNDGRAEPQAKCCEISNRVFPDLGINQPLVPERIKSVPDRRVFVDTALANNTCDELAVHAFLESAIRSKYPWLASVLRQVTSTV